MFLITAIKEVNKNPLSHPPPPWPPLPSVSHNCCVLPAWEWQGGMGAAVPRPTSGPWSQGHAGVLLARGHAVGKGEKLGSPGAGPPLLRLQPACGGATPGAGCGDGSPGAAGGIGAPPHPTPRASPGGDQGQPLGGIPRGAHPTEPVLLPSQGWHCCPGRAPGPWHGSPPCSADMGSFEDSEAQQSVSHGEAAVIRAPRIASFPRPQVTWFRDGRKISPSSRV